MKFQYKSYKIVQSEYNCHICIYDKENNLVMHVEATRMNTKEELKDLIKFYLIMKENI